MRATRYLILGLALSLTTFAIAAQQLRDPTRPPAGASKGTSTSGAAKSRARSGMVLQTVLISEDRRVAVISGRLMSVGDTISGFRLTEIREGEVVMKKRSKTRTLRLFPDVHMSDPQVATLSGQKERQQ